MVWKRYEGILGYGNVAFLVLNGECTGVCDVTSF